MRIAVICLALLVAGCLDTPVDTTGVPTLGAPPAANPITGLTMRYGEVELAVGETTQLAFTPRLTNNGAFIPLSLLWRSTALEIATVDANGIVTAVSPGQAYVTVTVDGYSGQTIVKVRAPAPAGP
ncbi:MAG: Ig-like domain-containing protein [Gemmatimonadaceae bacterium]